MKRIIFGGIVMGYCILMIATPPMEGSLLPFSIILVMGSWLLLWGVKTHKRQVR